MDKQTFLAKAKSTPTKFNSSVGEVYLRRLSLKESSELKSVEGVANEILIRTLVDADGNRWFERIDELESLDGVVVVELSQLAIRHNTITTDDVRQLEKKID